MAKSRAKARKQVRMNIVIAGLAMLGVAATLGGIAFRGEISYFASPTEIIEGELVSGEKLVPGKKLRLGGLVAEGTVKVTADGLTHLFSVTDRNETVPVRYEGALPDLFREGQGVVVSGKLDDHGVLIGTEVLAKHDENYMPKEAVDAMKRAGTWQHNQE